MFEEQCQLGRNLPERVQGGQALFHRIRGAGGLLRGISGAHNVREAVFHDATGDSEMEDAVVVDFFDGISMRRRQKGWDFDGILLNLLLSDFGFGLRIATHHHQETLMGNHQPKSIITKIVKN